MRRVEPGPGQESVWDYPRPPRVEPVLLPVRVELGGAVVAHTQHAVRVLETSHPPVVYVPFADVAADVLVPSDRSTFCEFKGIARYWTVQAGGQTEPDAAWSYPEPAPGFATLRGLAAFYASRMSACWIGDERVRPQEGDFYGGWITSSVVGPFKGAPDTWGW